MKVQRVVFLLAILLFGFEGLLSAQPTGSAGKVATEIRLSQNVVPAGDTVAAAVVMNIDEGWHVNAHDPTLDYLIGTELNINDQTGLTVSEIQYPKSERFSFAFAGEPLDVYHGSAPIFVTLKASSKLEPGTYTLDGSLRVQACDDKSCLPPSTIDISIPVDVAAANTGFQSINQELFSGNAGESISSSSASLSDNSIASMFDERGAILAFLGIFLIGLALNLTPCVYPMLSVTVSLFGGRADQQTNTLQSFGMASIYVLGIVSMYSVLGVAAAYTGSLFGSWLQSSVLFY
jgi:thiol:disulfide interchange protein DsbD